MLVLNTLGKSWNHAHFLGAPLSRNPRQMHPPKFPIARRTLAKWFGLRSTCTPVTGVKKGGAQSRIPLFPPTFWNSYPAYQKNPISNPPYPISFPNLQIPHSKKFNDKILHTNKNERQILLSRFFICAPKCTVIYSPQLFTDYKEANYNGNQFQVTNNFTSH